MADKIRLNKQPNEKLTHDEQSALEAKKIRRQQMKKEKRRLKRQRLLQENRQRIDRIIKRSMNAAIYNAELQRRGANEEELDRTQAPTKNTPHQGFEPDDILELVSSNGRSDTHSYWVVVDLTKAGSIRLAPLPYKVLEIKSYVDQGSVKKELNFDEFKERNAMLVPTKTVQWSTKQVRYTVTYNGSTKFYSPYVYGSTCTDRWISN